MLQMMHWYQQVNVSLQSITWDKDHAFNVSGSHHLFVLVLSGLFSFRRVRKLDIC